MNAATQIPGKPPWRLPGVPEHVEEFLLCILFHFLLPFLPLLVELTVLGRVERKTLLLFFAVYPLSIGVTSRSRLIFGSTIVLGLVYSTASGLASGKIMVPQASLHFGAFFLAVVVFFHACERFNRHVAEQEFYWEFGKGENRGN